MEYTYTPQQMMGYQGYNSSVRIGNWNEDLELQEQQLKNFLKQKAQGTLASDVMRKKIARHHAKIQLSRANKDGYVEFGSIVMVQNQLTKGCISIDLDTKLHHLKDRFGVTAVPPSESVARNCFIIEK